VSSSPQSCSTSRSQETDDQILLFVPRCFSSDGDRGKRARRRRRRAPQWGQGGEQRGAYIRPSITPAASNSNSAPLPRAPLLSLLPFASFLVLLSTVIRSCAGAEDVQVKSLRQYLAFPESRTIAIVSIQPTCTRVDAYREHHTSAPVCDHRQTGIFYSTYDLIEFGYLCTADALLERTLNVGQVVFTANLLLKPPLHCYRRAQLVSSRYEKVSFRLSSACHASSFL
jgi:hypothetical protein